MYFFVLAFILTISFSILVSAIFKPISLTVLIIYLYLFSFAEIILVTEIAGLTNSLNQPLFLLFLHSIFTGFAFLIWSKAGKPPLFPKMGNYLQKLKGSRIIASIKKHPAIWLLGAIVTSIYFVNAIIITQVPPNNHDGMTSHMVRVAYWLQHGNLWPWPTWNFTQQIYPINAQLQILWSVIFIKSDILAGFPQWLAAVAGLFVVYGFGRLLGADKHKSIFMALVWMLLPEIILESTTTQNHLIAGVLFGIGLFLLFLGLKFNRYEPIIASSLSISLALGTHQIVFFCLPGLALVLFLILLKKKKNGLRITLSFLASGLIFFLVFGSFIYVVNLSRYGNIFMDAKSDNLDAALISGKSDRLALANLVNNIKINSIRYFYSSFDLTGLPNSFNKTIYELRTKIANRLFTLLKLPIEGNQFILSWWPRTVSEDTAWFGIIGFFTIPPLVVMQFIEGVRKKDILRLGIIIVSISYLFVWAGIGIVSQWSPFQGRMFIVLSIILFPFLALIPFHKPFYFFLYCAIIVISVYQAFFILVNNFSKPLIGPAAIWKLNWTQKISLNAGEQYYLMIDKVEQTIPAQSNLGILLDGGYEYPLFGQNFSRKLFPIYPDSQLMNSDWLDQQKINWLLVCKPIPAPPIFHFVDSVYLKYFSQTCTIYSRDK